MKRQIRKMIQAAVILVILVISQAVSAAPLHPVIDSGPVSQFVYDNFDDNATDPSLWLIHLKDSGPMVSEINQRLEFTLPADSAGDDFAAWYDSVCQLRGDYDIQVDYELLTWPLASGARIGLTDSHANMHRVSSGTQPNDYPGGPDFYMTLFDTAGYWSTEGITPTSDLSGKLRLQRVGDTINTFYFANSSWVLDASNSDPAYTTDTPFALGAWSADSVFTDQEVKIAFDNMMINAGELVCPNTPAPDLAITQVADQETVSTGDPVGFTITITNNGDATANIVTLTNPLPIYNELDWSIGGTDAAACLMTDGVVSCNFQDIEPGEVKTIRLTAPEYVYYGKCFSPIITSTATLMAYNQPVNKTATASVTVLCPYMFIDIVSDTFNVPAGDPVNYTVTIGNIGDGNAKDVDAFLDIQNAPGMSWAITEVIPSSAASNCAMELDGTWTELECLFDQFAPQEEVIIKFTSPTTLESCGMYGIAGGVWASNSVGFKTKMYYIPVNCPVGDTTPPVITPTISGTLGANGWYTSDVSLIWSVTDPESAVSSTSGCEAVSITQDQSATDYTCTATSAGGTNSANVTIARDATKPVTTVTGVTEGATYILGSVPEAYRSTTDNLSGVATQATLVLTGGDAQGLGAITATWSGALDRAGNAADPVIIHYTVVPDTTPPVITPTVTGTLGANGWYTGDVSLTWDYSDPESPIRSLTGCRDESITQDQAATEYACAATSGGGTSSATVNIKRDATKPVTSVTNVVEGATYALGSVPQAGCSTTDNLSGVATEAILLLTGGDVQGLGSITATCSGALDSAGNAADPAIVHFTVVNPVPDTYNFSGFLQPVDNPGPGPSYIFNSVKAGGAVPFRFSLGGDQGLGILAEGYPTSRPVSCTTAALTDPIEQTVSAGNSSLSYDAASDTYTYVWKTNKGWAGTCRVLTVQLDDGTQHLAYFQFK